MYFVLWKQQYLTSCRTWAGFLYSSMSSMTQVHVPPDASLSCTVSQKTQLDDDADGMSVVNSRMKRQIWIG